MNIDMASVNLDVNLGGYNVNQSVIAHIKEASNLTGVNLEYLLAKAGQESSFETNAKSNLSTATGIYQFTESTWLEQFKLHGYKYGYSKLASKIEFDDNHRFIVKDKKFKQQILDLRKDPRTSAMLAAEFAKSNQTVLEETLKINITPSDLYLAHFLGAKGAITLIEAIKENEKQYADKLFYEASKANPKIFYKAGNSNPRTVKEVYNLVNRLFEASISRFTNLPPALFATLPKVLPQTKIIKENKPKTNRLTDLLKDENDFAKNFDIDKFNIINPHKTTKIQDINFDNIIDNAIPVPKLPSHIAHRMLPQKIVLIDDKNISFPEINFINELINNLDNF